MLKLIRNEKEFKIVDENSEWSIDLDCDFENQTGKNYHLEKGKTNLLKFKDNNGFTRYITESKCVDGYKLEYKTEKNMVTKGSNIGKSSKKVQYNWIDFATDDEKIMLDEIKNNCLKRLEAKINNPRRIEILTNIDKLLKIKNTANDEDIILLVDSKLEKLNKMLEEFDKI